MDRNNWFPDFYFVLERRSLLQRWGTFKQKWKELIPWKSKLYWGKMINILKESR